MYQQGLPGLDGLFIRVTAVVMAMTAVLALGALQLAAAAVDPYEPDGEPELSTNSPAPGDSFTISGDGFMAGSQVRVVIFSEPVVLGASTVSAAGEAVLTVTVPSSFAPGSTHTVEMQGVDPSGDVRILSLEVVLAAAGDGDDGLPAAGFGATTLGLGVLGGALLLSGVALLALGRARRRVTHS
jgi:hypothetical protein